MPTVDVINEQNDKVGTAELPAPIFEGEVNKLLLREAVVAWMRNRRAGTSSSKGRSEVSGSSRKPWRQKGTGRARVGTIRSPLWVGGGVVFGPKPRDFSSKLPRKKRRAALRSALRHQMQEGNIMVLEGITLEEPKTSRVADLLKALDIQGQKVLVVVPAESEIFEKSARNIPGVLVATPEMLNAYLVLAHRKMLIFREALARMEEVSGK
jgi:large subunit ribosomal protein L4